MENWETDANLLKTHHFVFPAGSWGFMGAEGASRLEPITRRYRPESAALDQLVEALYQLLMDVPGDPPATAPAPAELACLSAPHE